jgi:phage terminase large subunit-like protein
MCIASFHYFVKWCWSLSKGSIEFIDDPYVKFICDTLQSRMEDMCNGIPRKGLLLAIAPATGKSFIMSVCAPIFLWLLKPESTSMNGSVNASLALQFATESRSIITNPEFQKYFPFELRDDVNSKNEFMNLQGGKRISFGFETPVIGKHSPYLQCFDDVQSLNLLASEPDRLRINTALSQFMPTRQANSKFAQRWLVMQRLATNDCFAHLQNFDIDEVICLPAELNGTCTNPELYNADGLLAPRLLPRERLDQLRKSLGPAAYQAQINQNPSALENATIRPEWFLITDYIPENYGSRLHIFLDTAVVSTKQSDFNAAVACLTFGNYILVTAVFHEKLGFMDLAKKFPEWVRSLQGFDERTQIHIEPKGSGQQILDYLKKESHLNAKPVIAPDNNKGLYTKSKEMRMQGVAPKIEQGRVKLYRAHWNDLLINECCGLSSHDDLSDALQMAVDTLLNGKPNNGPHIGFCGGGSSYHNNNIENSNGYKILRA